MVVVVVVVKVVRENEKRGEFKDQKRYIGFTFRVSILEREIFLKTSRERRMGHGDSL